MAPENVIGCTGPAAIRKTRIGAVVGTGARRLNGMSNEWERLVALFEVAVVLGASRGPDPTGVVGGLLERWRSPAATRPH